MVIKQTVYVESFVLTKDGKEDFGEISPEIAGHIGMKAGKIKLRKYGEEHIGRPRRIDQIRSNGYKSAGDLVEDVAKNFDAIYKRDNGTLLLSKKGIKKGVTLYVKLELSENEDFYDVRTGMIMRNTFWINKKPAWEKSQTGLLSDSVKAPTIHSTVPSETPSAVSGKSDDNNLSQNENMSSEKKLKKGGF
ncbi:MAG: hypothetical protein LBT84_04555 [Spirochaetia bacterium]|jgi:hypothetical protein|nr:hypothetical protein [Spirochaetia bacterium]